MEIESLLLWLVALSCLMPFAGALIQGRPMPPAHWRYTLLGVLGVESVAFAIVPDSAGYIGLALYLLAVLAPQLAHRQLQRCLAERSWRTATGLAWIATALHPWGTWRDLPRSVRATRAVHSGDPAALAALGTAPGGESHLLTQTMAVSQAMQARDWHTVRALLAPSFSPFEVALQGWQAPPSASADEAPTELAEPPVVTPVTAPVSVFDPDMLTIYLRAVLETEGLLAGLRHWRRWQAPIEASRTANEARLFLLAWAGRADLFARLEHEGQRILPPTVFSVWHATAEIAAGRLEAAGTRLNKMEGHRTIAIRQGVAWRRENPPPPCPPLAPEDLAILDHLEHECRQAAAYSGQATIPLKSIMALMIVLNGIMFVVTEIMGGSTEVEVLIRAGGLYMVDTDAVIAHLLQNGGAPLPFFPADAMPQVHRGLLAGMDQAINGEWWRLLTANFLHAGPIHLMFNILGLVIFGGWAERRLGWWRFLIVYLGSGICGMLLVLALMASGWMRVDLVVGASACVMGLIGASLAILLRGWRREGAQVARQRFYLIALVVCVQTLMDVFSPQTAIQAHIGGCVVGFVLGLLLWRPVNPARSPDVE